MEKKEKNNVSQEQSNIDSELTEEIEEVVIDAEDITLEEVELTTEQWDQLQEENNNLSERLLRLQAEYENYRKRTEKERIAERKYKVQDLAIELLPVIDNFERALQTEVSEENKGFHDGIQMVYNQFIEALKGQGIEAMNVVNEEFDPNLHHAVMQIEDETIAPNTVTEELQKGFLLKDKVIRPAMVKVNK